jgi:hypothetical protein
MSSKMTDRYLPSVSGPSLDPTEAEGYTLVVCYLSTGDKGAMLFDNSKKVG